MAKDNTPLLIVIGSSSFFLLLMVVLALIGNSLGWFDFLFEDDDKSSPSPSLSTNRSRQSSPSSTASRSAGSQSAGSQSAGSQSAGSQSAGTGTSTGTSGGSSFDYPSTPAGETCNIAACNKYMYDNIVIMPPNTPYEFVTSSTGTTNMCRGCPKRKYTWNGIVENVEVNGQIINTSTSENLVRKFEYDKHANKYHPHTNTWFEPAKQLSANIEDCKVFCNLTQGCHGFTHTRMDDVIICNLHNSNISTGSLRDYQENLYDIDTYIVKDTRGTKSYPQVKHSSNHYRMLSNNDVTGSDLQYYNNEQIKLTSSADDCKAVCDDLSVCGGFSYRRSDKTCYLKDTTLASNTPTDDPSIDTYVKQPGTFCNADACNRFIHNNINNDTAFARTDEFAEGPCKKCPSRGYVHNGTTRTLVIDDVPTDVTHLSKLQRYDMAKLSPY